MPVIKSIPSSPASFRFGDIHAEANRIVERAKEQAEQIVEHARRGAQQIEREANENGYRQGLQRGLKEGLARGIEQGRAQTEAEHRPKLVQSANLLQSTFSQFDALAGEFVRQASDDVLKLAMAIAERITRQAGLLNDDVLRANIAQAVSLVVDKSNVRILVHPAQWNLANTFVPDLQAKIAELKHVEMVEDASIAPGGCKVIAGQGVVDATIDTQLDRIFAELLPASELDADIDDELVL